MEDPQLVALNFVCSSVCSATADVSGVVTSISDRHSLPCLTWGAGNSQIQLSTSNRVPSVLSHGLL